MYIKTLDSSFVFVLCSKEIAFFFLKEYASARYLQMFRDHEMIRIFINDLPDNVELLMTRMKKFREIDYLCKDFPSWIEDYEAEGFGAKKTEIAGYFENFGLYLASNPSVLKDVRFERDA